MKDILEHYFAGDRRALARLITIIENDSHTSSEFLDRIYQHIGNAYRIGVTNIKNVINTERIFAMSLITALRRDKIKPSPSINKIIGIINIGSNIIAMFGVIL